jgi:hypothetical protein
MFNWFTRLTAQWFIDTVNAVWDDTVFAWDDSQAAWDATLRKPWYTKSSSGWYTET